MCSAVLSVKLSHLRLSTRLVFFRLAAYVTLTKKLESEHECNMFLRVFLKYY